MKNSVHLTGAGSQAVFAATELGRALAGMQASATPSNRAIAAYLLRNPFRIAAWSIEDASQHIQVSTATVSRFARTMGYRGYPELRAALADTLQAALHPVEKLRETFERGRPDGASPFDDGLHSTLAAARSVVEALRAESLAEITDRLLQARTVYVMGFGLSAHLAGLLTLGLQPFCPQLINVVEFGGTEVAAGRLMNVGAGDALVALSFPRYAQDAIQLAAYARDRGAYVLAITDAESSPLSAAADRLLVAPSAHPVLPSSLVAAVLVVEALITSAMLGKRDNVDQAAKLAEAISSYLYRGDAAATPSRSRDRKRHRAKE